MLQSLLVRLETNNQEKDLLLETMKQYNMAANYVADKAFEWNIMNKYELQKKLYYDIRKRFNLSAQFAIRVISKVVEAYKRDRKIKPGFKEFGAIQYDQRNLSFKGLDRVSMITANGRMKFRTRIGDYQRKMITGRAIRGQTDLIFRRDIFFLIVVVDVAEETEFDTKNVLGIDFGVENIATDSDGQVFEGKKIEEKRQQYNRLRKGLQKIGTRSAKRKLNKISGKERRFKRDTNHVISKMIVLKAKGTIRAIVIENLRYIHSKVTVIRRRSQRDRHSKWSFGQLRSFITYKAKREGVPLNIVNPRNTSRQCPECKYIDKRNRKTRNNFECLQCHYKEMADYVAARNIAAKAAVNQPIVTPLFLGSYKPPSFRKR